MSDRASESDLSGYWDGRIRSSGRHRSIGDIGWSEAVNQYRKEALLAPLDDVLRRHGVDLSNARVLDGGCGTGLFSEHYARAGARVTGVDFSAEAIRTVKDLGIPGEFRQGDLAEVDLPEKAFDVVHSFSVLYHIVDDAKWAEALRNLARTVAPGGLMVLVVDWMDEPRVDTFYQKQRPRSAYLEVLRDEMGLEHLETHALRITPRFTVRNETLSRLTTRIPSFFVDDPSQKLVVFRKPADA